MRKTGRIRTMLHMIHLVASASPWIFSLQYFWSIINGISLAVTPIVLEQIFQIVLESELKSFTDSSIDRLGVLPADDFSSFRNFHWICRILRRNIYRYRKQSPVRTS